MTEEQFVIERRLAKVMSDYELQKARLRTDFLLLDRALKRLRRFLDLAAPQVHVNNEMELMAKIVHRNLGATESEA